MSDEFEKINEMDNSEVEPTNNVNTFGNNDDLAYSSSELNMQIEADTSYTSNYNDLPQMARVNAQVEKEREKFNRRQEKISQKSEKKAKRREARKGKKHSLVLRITSFILAAASFGVIALGTMYYVGDGLGIFDKKSSTNQTVPTTQIGAVNKEKETNAVNTGTTSPKVVDVSDIVEEVMPSIVAITSKTLVQSGGMKDWFYDYYFGGSNNGTYEETGAGSGIIIGQNDTELLVITNKHVVDGADSLQVQFIDNKSVDATIKGTNSEKDLAIVAIKLSDIDKESLEKIKIATLGESDTMKVGEGTIAIGNALGYGQSVTVGVISALDREVTIDLKKMILLQTDAAINPGNSGGALLNMKGEVIGINAAKYSSDSVEGMGFAIPISSVKEIVDKLMTRDTLAKVDSDKKGYLNIYGRDVNDEMAVEFNAPEGVLIREIIQGGAAEKAGLEKLDIITKLNDDAVTSMDELLELLEYYEEGTTVKLTVQYLDNKEYKEKLVDVVLGGVME